MKVAIGIDIEGTKIKVGMVDMNGNIIGSPESIPTLANTAGEFIIERLVHLIEKIKSQSNSNDLIGIGIGCTGPLDIDEGIILKCNNLPTLHNYPLKKKIEDTFGLPAKVNNDANAMMLGEALWGAGKDIKTILGITLGTGLGASLIVDKRIIKGVTGCAGEIWTSPYREGIIEDYVSGTAIERMYRETTGKQLSGEEIADLARKRDSNAIKVWAEFTQALTFALSWTVNMIDPDAVIVGGSVIHSADLFWECMMSEFKRFVCPQPASHIKIMPASLGDNAGFMGAASLMLI